MAKSSGPNLREQRIRQATNDLLKERFTAELGERARVERSVLSSDRLDGLRAVIADVGQNLQDSGAVPEGMKYRGSLSIHVFSSEVLKTAAFATLSNLGTMDFSLADGALRELTGATMESYAKERQKLRSGF